MGLPLGLDNYIQESIEDSVGLPVSVETLQSKILALDQSRRMLQGQVFALQDALNDRIQKIERAKSEAAMNAQALRKSIEQNQRLNEEVVDLTMQIKKLTKECSLYDNDREALMEFGNDADQRAREAEIRALEAEDACRKLSEELHQSKGEIEMLMVNRSRQNEELQMLKRKIFELENGRTDELPICNQSMHSKDDPFSNRMTLEESLINSMVESMMIKDDEGELEEAVAKAHYFLESRMEEEKHWRLIQCWNSLNPSIRNMIMLAAEVDSLRQDKDQLRVNLSRAEGEASLLFEENKLLDVENKKLIRRYHRERSHQGSPSSHSSKSKRRASPRRGGGCGCGGRVIEFDGPVDSPPRQPLSPIEHNVQPCRMINK